QIAALESTPEAARRTLDVALATDAGVRQAGLQLQGLVARFDRLETQVDRLSNRQEMSIDLQQEMLAWQRLSVGLMLTFYGEKTAEPVAREQFRSALAALGEGRLTDARPALAALAEALPASGAVQAALGVVQAEENNLPAAQATLAAASRLNPADKCLQ